MMIPAEHYGPCLMQPDLPSGINPLDQLRPIVLPQHDISWWPLAPGWWALIISPLVILALVYWLKPQILSRQAEKKRWQSIHSLLEKLYLECQSRKENSLALQDYLQNSNAILKRTVHYFGSDPAIGSLIGDEWIKFLKKIYAPKTTSYAYLYSQQLYAKTCTENISLDELHHWACAWVKAFQKQSKNARRIKMDD